MVSARLSSKNSAKTARDLPNASRKNSSAVKCRERGGRAKDGGCAAQRRCDTGATRTPAGMQLRTTRAPLGSVFTIRPIGALSQRASKATRPGANNIGYAGWILDRLLPHPRIGPLHVCSALISPDDLAQAAAYKFMSTASSSVTARANSAAACDKSPRVAATPGADRAGKAARDQGAPSRSSRRASRRAAWSSGPR